MQITLNIYERGYQGNKQGKAFEPQVWHRAEFLQNNFVRFFSPDYLLDELYVEIPSVAEAPGSFTFEFNGNQIIVVVKYIGR